MGASVDVQTGRCLIFTQTRVNLDPRARVFGAGVIFLSFEEHGWIPSASGLLFYRDSRLERPRELCAPAHLEKG